MKRLCFSAGVLVLLFVLTLLNANYLGRLSTGFIDTLTQAQQHVEMDDWETAEQLTQEALDDWESHETYLYMVLRHSDNDQIQTGFQEVIEYLSCQDEGEYFAANVKLITQISLLYEMEQLTLKNLM